MDYRDGALYRESGDPMIYERPHARNRCETDHLLQMKSPS